MPAAETPWTIILAAFALGTLTERIGHAVRIDEHTMAADLVNDQIGVGEPLGVLDALKNHFLAPAPVS